VDGDVRRESCVGKHLFLDRYEGRRRKTVRYNARRGQQRLLNSSGRGDVSKKKGGGEIGQKIEKSQRSRAKQEIKKIYFDTGRKVSEGDKYLTPQEKELSSSSDRP